MSPSPAHLVGARRDTDVILTAECNIDAAAYECGEIEFFNPHGLFAFIKLRFFIWIYLRLGAEPSAQTTWFYGRSFSGGRFLWRIEYLVLFCSEDR